MQSTSRSNPAFRSLGPGGSLGSMEKRIAYLSPIAKMTEAELSAAVDRSKSEGVVKSWDDAAAKRARHQRYCRLSVAGAVLVVLAITIGLIASQVASNSGSGGLVSPTSPSLEQSRGLETLNLNVLATLSGVSVADFASPTSQASLDFCSGVETVSSLPSGSCTVVSARDSSNATSSSVAVSFQLAVPDSFQSELGQDEVVAELEAEVDDAARSGELLRTISALTSTDSFDEVTDVGGVQIDVVASPSPSVSASAGASASVAASSSPTPTTSRDPLITPSPTATGTPSPSVTASVSPSATPSASVSATSSTSPTSTATPSSSPSSTASPSPSPTPSPMQVVVVTPGDEAPVAIKAGMAEIRRSSAGEVLLLSHSQFPLPVDSTASASSSSMPTMASVPCGRSYDGLDWEPVPPGYCTFDCSMASGAASPSSNCVVTLPDDLFVARSIKTAPVPERQRMARHMLRATFGSSAQEIDLALASASGTFEDKAAAWVRAQMQLPATSHRAYFRQRSNARNPDPVVAGGVRGPCELSSRWVRFALSFTDEDQSLELRGDTLYVDGHPRTLVPPSYNTTLSAAGEQPWTICTVTESVGGDVRVGPGCSVSIANPAVSFGAGAGPAGRVAHRLATFTPVRLPARDALLLSASSGLSGCSVPGAGPIFATMAPAAAAGGSVSWVMFDSRLRFVRNTLDAPANVSHQADTACPKVRKTFFNAHSCVPAQRGCYSVKYAPVKFRLNATVIRAFYELSGRHLHYVTALRVEDERSPCSDTTTRWMRMTGDACADSEPAGTSSLDAGTLTFLQGAIQAADDGLQVVDISSRNGQCSTAATGVMINVTNTATNRTECWKHSHPDLLSVRDFSYWTRRHDGNKNARAAYRPNPIARIADTLGSAEFVYPLSHTMKRWDDNARRIEAVGQRLDQEVSFDQLPFAFQIPAVARYLGAEEVTTIDEGFEACGSPYEVANEPEKSYLYVTSLAGLEDTRIQPADQYLRGLATSPSKTRVWTNAVVKAPDQLRQRVAWALAQIFVVSEVGTNFVHHSEPFHVYNDIFVRNAFGNFRDTLAEVSFSPVMARMLTFDANRALEYSLRSGKELFPDENYAREIMQLFTIGLWELHQNGTYKRHPVTQELVPTYGTEDILDLSRLWTGFTLQPTRSNTDMVDGIFTSNRVDPLYIRPELHDAFPKRAVDGSHIGDRYPLCAELPPRMFLRKGATYRYLGTNPAPFLHADINPDTVTLRGAPWMVLDSDSSSLHSLLCDRSGTTGQCNLRSQIVLESNLACHGVECDADTARVVRVNRSSSLAPVYYEYLRPPCVEMAFSDQAYPTLDRRGTKAICVDQRLPAAAEVCCSPGSTQGYSVPGTYDEERITRATAIARCEARGLEACHTNRISRSYSYTVNAWSSSPCILQAQIQPSGRVTSVQTMPDELWQGFRDGRVGLDTPFGFRVNWVGDSVPLAQGAQYPAGECVERGESLLCNITVDTSTVFDGSLPANRTEVLAKLSIGHADPASLDAGALSECTTPACAALAANEGVAVFVNDSNSQAINDATVFRVTIASKVYFLSNRASVVRIGDTHAFRNPPSFMSLWEQTGRDAHWEVHAALDTYVAHPNVAPFIADLLIKRMVTSNPSPAYVTRVTTAFNTGSYEGFGTGKYGDMAATIAAILLDTEALSTAVEADPMHGRVREPLIKLLNLFRGLKYTPSEGREIDLDTMHLRIGMMAHLADSVFNFYQSDFRPGGAVSRASLVSPEMQIINTPTVVNWLNGIVSLAEYGLTDCDRGFGRRAYPNPSCSSVISGSRPGSDFWAGGLLWNQTDAGGMDAETVVEAMDLVLTGGRLSKHSREVMEAAYTEMMLGTGGADKAIRSLIELFAVAPEFSITSLHRPLNHTLASETPAAPPVDAAPSPSPSPQPATANASDYKAIVYLYLSGGADSHNFLIPSSSCTGPAEQYASVRTVVALDPDAQIELPVPPGSQPCSKFAIHSQLTKFKQLYDAGESAFVANIGPLIEPVTKQQFQTGAARLPPGLTAHNVQTRATQSVHAQSTSPLGVLGRIRDTLLGAGVQSSAYSISGTSLVLKGVSAAPPGDIVDRSNGAVRFDENNRVGHLRSYIDTLVSNGSTSMMGDAWTRSVTTGLSRSEQLADSLTTAGQLKQPFEALTIDTSSLSKQLEQAAKLVAARDFLGSKRDVFFVQLGGFDTHGDAFSVMETKLMQIDASLNSFVEEMKLQGVWEGVTIVTASEFARTITSNGAGTDHGWGGNIMLAGGALRGGQIFGNYPADITVDGPHNIGRGRLIPTTPWEAVWNGVASWFGVPQSDLEQVLPNVGNFPEETIFNTSRLYHSTA